MHLCDSVYRNVWDNICRAVTSLNLPKSTKVLDVGCWDGELTEMVVEKAGLSMDKAWGMDFFDDVLQRAKDRGIKAEKVDLENETFPFADRTFDLVVCNQVFEHLKNIYKPLDEIHRVLKPRGYLIFSVPNLSSFHNKVFLFFVCSLPPYVQLVRISEALLLER